MNRTWARVLAGTVVSVPWLVGAVPRADAATAPVVPAPPAVVDVEVTPTGRGWWVTDETGAAWRFGDAAVDAPSVALADGERVVATRRTPSGAGLWTVTSRGRVVVAGDAVHRGDLAALRLNGPVVDMAVTASGNGYLLVAADGGVFAFGDAAFAGSMGGRPLNAPVRSLATDPDGSGYWLVAADGGVFAFDAPFRGSMGGRPLNAPVVGIERYGNGYVLVAEDGGTFVFSDLPFLGSTGSNPPPEPVVAVAADPGGPGYVLVDRRGVLTAFGPALAAGRPGGTVLVVSSGGTGGSSLRSIDERTGAVSTGRVWDSPSMFLTGELLVHPRGSFAAVGAAQSRIPAYAIPVDLGGSVLSGVSPSTIVQGHPSRDDVSVLWSDGTTLWRYRWGAPGNTPSVRERSLPAGCDDAAETVTPTVLVLTCGDGMALLQRSTGARRTISDADAVRLVVAPSGLRVATVEEAGDDGRRLVVRRLADGAVLGSTRVWSEDRPAFVGETMLCASGPKLATNRIDCWDWASGARSTLAAAPAGQTFFGVGWFRP